jgi:AAHS family 4-hydroxybenzoate transporter-like MFS transporter
MRATVVGLMFCGFPLGAAVGGLAAAWLIPSYGWGSLFVLGGIVPLLLGPPVWTWLPGATRFRTVLRLRSRQARASTETGASHGSVERINSPVAQLFIGGSAGGTVLFWATLFLGLLLTYLLTNWIPLQAQQNGRRRQFDPRRSATQPGRDRRMPRRLPTR